MAEKQYYWLKLEKDFFKSKEIKKLRKIAGGDTLTIIYLKMALYSLENEGVLIYEGIEEDLAAELSLELDEEVENIKLVLAFLQNNKMIETKGEDFYLNRIPEMTGKETGAAKRMRISRQRKEDNKQLECNNVTKQLQDVTTSYTEKELDIELDIELEKELDLEKDIYYTSILKIWNLTNLPKLKLLSQKRKEKIKLRTKEVGLDNFLKSIDILNNSKFCLGENKNSWKADLDWLISNDTNIVKVLEGKYNDKKEVINEKKEKKYNSKESDDLFAELERRGI